MNKTPVLMSAENPDGWKLEDLLERLKVEIEEKSRKLQPGIDKFDVCTASPQDAAKNSAAKTIVEHNGRIIEHLEIAIAFQRGSMSKLDALGPDQGPSGTPRV